jgi:hypothetical protein
MPALTAYEHDTNYLSWFHLINPAVPFLIPLTRFPGFIWIIAVAFVVPRTIPLRMVSKAL